MRVHWLQHAEHEGLGSIAAWLTEQGHTVTGTRLHAGERLPPAQAFDWLIAMGGPMNIYEEGRYPWLRAEKDLINDACVINKRVLGICLGAQLVSDVLGGPVTRNEHMEIGWFDVFLTEEGENTALFADMPKRFAAFHWHGDTFAMPPGCKTLMSSEACANQAFVADGGRICALQFHLEIRRQDARAWLEQDPPPEDRYVQSPAEMLRDPARFELNRRLLRTLLERQGLAPRGA